MTSADHTQRPDLRLLISAAIDVLRAVALRCRDVAGHDQDSIRDLYRLRASLSEALFGPVGGGDTVPVEPLSPLDPANYQFTTHRNKEMVHLTDPNPPSGRERTLCHKVVGFVHSRRPEGKLCRTCCYAFANGVFPELVPVPA